MRPLRLQIPIMSGPDVADWQTFLNVRGFQKILVDGAFGMDSERITRTYQTSAGLTVDGVVGSATLARAVTEGYAATTGASLAGMDADVDCSSFAGRIAATGVTFAARYYSETATKTLTAAEAQRLSNNGVTLVAVFEDNNNSVNLFSAAMGAKQAARALDLAAVIGQPAGSAIYFAVDFDPQPGDVQGPICDYFKTVKQTLGSAAVQYAVGVYGSGLTCRLIRDSGLATFTWLAGSIGFREYAKFRREADIVQLAPERQLFEGLIIDDDIAQNAEFGGFKVEQALTTVPT